MGSDRFDLVVAFHQFSFLATGICSTLGVQWLFYAGAASGSSFFTQLSGYTGSVLVGLLIPWMVSRRRALYQQSTCSSDKEKTDFMDNCSVIERTENYSKGGQAPVEGPVIHSTVAKLATIDVIAGSFVTFGFSLIGSGMYQVIFSSVVIWCAMLNYFLLHRVLSFWQWVAIFGTSAGLALCAFENMTMPQGSNMSGGLAFGTLMALGGTFLYACMYVYADCILSKQKPPPLPVRLCFYNGLYTTMFALVYIGLYTVPHLDDMIHIQPDITRWQIFTMYSFITIVNATHSWNYYELIDRTGSVATGILQAVRAVLVYGISHLWYCANDSAQCFTVKKGFGSLLVISCVLLYTYASKK
ncbi:hypothetical protein LRAMOSA05287 [Lichtheimia ramosa]|uniref:EamA domain-containing protein n=1 Tax=Lichtheimia ramosa TaxID=688394 RepID=A0A077X0U5_9FUNG|nr:hypothetical protein LRAMOSA05287 [Lichtheimia ramosa]